MSERSLDIPELRRALGTFATGVTVVTTLDAHGAPRGFTANSFTSVSLEPALILVCIAKSATSCLVFRQAERYAVNILAENQRDVSALFSSPGGDRFASLKWSARATGCPIIEGVVAWLDCSMHEVVDAGDHYILIGRIVDYGYSTSRPLGYCRGAYVAFGLEQQAVRIAEEDHGTRLLALIEHEQAILLERDSKDGALTLPSATRIGDAGENGSLLNRIKTAGVDAELSFLFAVYEDPQTGTHTIVYRGEARRVDARAANALIPFGDIPWERIRDDAVRSMIERYVQEREADSFGVYVGAAKSGRVRPLAGGD